MILLLKDKKIIARNKKMLYTKK